MGDIDKETRREFFLVIGGAALLGLVGGIIYTSANAKLKKELTKVAYEVSEKIEEKMAIDIRKTDTLELSDDFYIDLTGIQLNNGSEGFVVNDDQSIDFFGLGNDEQAYKLTYDLTDEQMYDLINKFSEYSTENLKESIRLLESIYQELEISKLEVKDLNAVTLGLTKEREFKALAKAFGPAVPNNKFFKGSEAKTADAFLPIYSTIETKEINGEQVAIMTVEGLQFINKDDPNILNGITAGLLFGKIMDSPTLGYAFGVSIAYSTASEDNDIFNRKEEIMIKLSEKQKNMDENELRQEIMNALLNNSQKYTTNTKYMSENLISHRNSLYSKIVEYSHNKSK